MDLGLTSPSCWRQQGIRGGKVILIVIQLGRSKVIIIVREVIVLAVVMLVLMV